MADYSSSAWGSGVWLTKKGKRAPADVLRDKAYLLVYFSASWCPPCQRFTPVLSTFYKRHAERLKFEVVFVSNDKDIASMQAYYDKMPWAAVPYGDEHMKGTFMSTYTAEGGGIPELVIVDLKDGGVVKRGAVQDLWKDVEGIEFPYKPLSWVQCLPVLLFIVAIVLSKFMV